MTGWNVGFRTIDLMKLIRESTAYNLAQAKALVERVLDGGEVEIRFVEAETAQRFWIAAKETGVIACLKEANRTE